MQTLKLSQSSLRGDTDEPLRPEAAEECVSSGHRSGSHLGVHVDEAVGALQRIRRPANHSAVVEMVMVLQTSYLSNTTSKHEETFSREAEALVFYSLCRKRFRFMIQTNYPLFMKTLEFDVH